MNYNKTQAMIAKLMANATGLKYGAASITIKMHDGRIVQVSYSTQEHIRVQASSKPIDDDLANETKNIAFVLPADEE